MTTLDKKAAPSDGDDINNASVRVTESKEIATIFDVYLHKFGKTRDFVDLFDILNKANSNTTINFHLNNPGGYLHNGIQLLNTLETSRAGKVNVYVEAPIYSMATIFACKAMKLGIPVHIGNHAFFMFHDYSGGNFGKGGELITSALHERKWTTELFVDCCFPFLSQDEIVDLLKGQDIYLPKEDVLKRMKVVKKYISSKRRKKNGGQ